jgi:hypothetical protein
MYSPLIGKPSQPASQDIGSWMQLEGALIAMLKLVIVM